MIPITFNHLSAPTVAKVTGFRPDKKSVRLSGKELNLRVCKLLDLAFHDQILLVKGMKRGNRTHTYVQFKSKEEALGAMGCTTVTLDGSSFILRVMNRNHEETDEDRNAYKQLLLQLHDSVKYSLLQAQKKYDTLTSLRDQEIESTNELITIPPKIQHPLPILYVFIIYLMKKLLDTLVIYLPMSGDTKNMIICLMMLNFFWRNFTS